MWRILIIYALFCSITILNIEVDDVIVHASQGQIKPYSVDICELRSVLCDTKITKQIYATVTAYNTVPWQTDSSPCVGAAGIDICGRDDVTTCPRRYSLGTRFRIGNKTYTCLDRTALKYDDRFDISFDKDIQGAREFGKQRLLVTIIK